MLSDIQKSTGLTDTQLKDILRLDNRQFQRLKNGKNTTPGEKLLKILRMLTEEGLADRVPTN